MTDGKTIETLAAFVKFILAMPGIRTGNRREPCDSKRGDPNPLRAFDAPMRERNVTAAAY